MIQLFAGEVLKPLLGSREQALRITQEAVDIRRGLAEQRPDVFLPDLALSLGALGSVRLAAGRPDDAIAAFAAGLRIILPMVTRFPQAFGRRAFSLASNLRRVAQQADLPIPEDLTPLLDQLLVDQ